MQRSSIQNVTVLITCGGSAAAVSLIQILKSQNEIPCKIIVTDVDPLAPGLFIADVAHKVPPSSSPEYINTLRQICESESVDILIPGLSNEYIQLSLQSKVFTDIGVAIPLSPTKSINICSDKERVCEFVTSLGFRTPICYPTKQAKETPESIPLPLIVKPRVSTSSRNTFMARKNYELAFFVEYVNDAVIQEYIDGDEYTIDVLCSLDGEPIIAIPRRRIEVKAGLTIKGVTINSDVMIEQASRIARELHLVGLINIQCKLSEGSPVFYDINCRPAAGGLPLSVASGPNLPLLLLKLLVGQTISQNDLKWHPGVYMTRYSTPLFLKEGRTGDFESL